MASSDDSNESIDVTTLPQSVGYNHGSSMLNGHGNAPFLMITEQPKNRYRFRYNSEGNSHGGIQGASSDKGQGKTRSFPSIAIINYKGPARIVVSLVTDEKVPKVHAHELMGKNCQNGLCVVELKSSTNMTATFPNLGVHHATRKNVVQILENRIQESMKLQSLFTTRGGAIDEPYELSAAEKESAKKQAVEQANAMKMDRVRLCFQAYLMDERGTYGHVLESVMSDPIFDNKKESALKICRMDRQSGSCTGGDEVFLLCEKVKKDDIKVRFFQEDTNGHLCWEDFGTFGPHDVHRQFAIVFRTPSYVNTELTNEVVVQIELLKPSDGDTSESKEFIFYPRQQHHDEMAAKRRKPMPFDFSGSGDGGIDPVFSSPSVGASGGRSRGQRGRKSSSNRSGRNNSGNNHVAQERRGSASSLKDEDLFEDCCPIDKRQVANPEYKNVVYNPQLTQFSKSGMATQNVPVTFTLQPAKFGTVINVTQQQTGMNNTQQSTFIQNSNTGLLRPSNNTQQSTFVQNSNTVQLRPSNNTQQSTFVQNSNTVQLRPSNITTVQQPVTPQRQRTGQVSFPVQKTSVRKLLPAQPSSNVGGQRQTFGQSGNMVSKPSVQYSGYQVQQQRNMSPMDHQPSYNQTNFNASSNFNSFETQPYAVSTNSGGFIGQPQVVQAGQGAYTTQPQQVHMQPTQQNSQGTVVAGSESWERKQVISFPTDLELLEWSEQEFSSLVPKGLSEPAEKPASVHQDNRMALHIAEHMANALEEYAATGEVKDLLLPQRHLVAIQDDDGDTTLHQAVINRQIKALSNLVNVAITLPNWMKLVNQYNHLRQTSLHIAVGLGEHEAIKILLRCKASVSLVDRHGNTPVHLAAKQGDSISLKLLLQSMSKEMSRDVIDVINHRGYAASHLASLACSTDCTKLLHEAGADMNLSENLSGRTPLHFAVEKGDLATAGYLILEASVDVNAPTFNGDTPLHYACGLQNVGLTALLIAAGSDPLATNCECKPDSDEGHTPFDVAGDNKQLIKILEGESYSTTCKSVEDEDIDIEGKTTIKSQMSSPAGDMNLLKYSTRCEIGKLLDHADNGKDWVALAEAMGLGSVVSLLRGQRGGATLSLLNSYEAYDGNVQQLCNLLIEIGRPDVVNIIQDSMKTREKQNTVESTAKTGHHVVTSERRLKEIHEEEDRLESGFGSMSL